MTPDDLADEWDRMATACDENAKATRSLDVHARERARATQLRQCAMQLRLVLGNARRTIIATAGTEHLAAELAERGEG